MIVYSFFFSFHYIIACVIFIYYYFLKGTSSVARGYSGYVDQLLGNPMRNYFREHLSMGVEFLAAYPDLFAFGLVLTLTGISFIIPVVFILSHSFNCTFLLRFRLCLALAILTLGVKESTRFNNIFTMCNLCIVSYVIICGCFKSIIIYSLHNKHAK
jgi:cationic amino acid transporter 3